MVRKIAIITGVIFSLVIIGIICALHIMTSKMTDGDGISRLDSLGITVHSEMITYYEQKIHTVQIGDPGNPKVLFIHGSPGQWYDWSNMYKSDSLRSKYCMISYDRPGLGLTTIPAQRKLSEQAQVAARVMDHYGNKGEMFVLVGHSYGGAVVEQILLDHSDRVQRAIYAGPTLSPEMQQSKWYNTLAGFKIINITLPKALRSSNYEMVGLSESLEKNKKRLASIEKPITFIQGKKDVLVPYATVDYYKTYKPSGVEYIIDDDMNHFIPWSHPHLVINALLE